jgi:carboxymethylenebutenolidase
MPDVTLPSPSGEVPGWLAVPESEGPWPGVVVVHDANGLGTDVRRHADWLASEGFLALAPDLYRGGARLPCMIRTMREVAAQRDGPSLQAVEAARRHLRDHPDGTGAVAVLGFCMGGGIALALAPRGTYDAASVNYGAATKDVEARLPDACPIVASFGGADPTLRGAADRLERILAANGVPHDVKEYEGAGHGFMNDHPPDETPWYVGLLMRLSNVRYDEGATRDARRRIAAFLRRHLETAPDATG